MNSKIFFICRPEFTDALVDECRQRGGTGIKIKQPGLIEVDTGIKQWSDLIFERQRLVHPSLIPSSDLKPLSDATIRALLGTIAAANPLWTVHFLALEQAEADDAADTKRLEGIWSNTVRLGKKFCPDIEKRFRPPHRLKPGGIVVQLLLTDDGLWFSHEIIESMVNPRPGGFIRQRFDPLAPSRSYLKMEEALERMTGQPAPGEKVIDLGAAPGGWTYSFVKRGCDVIAVDHGPMKLPSMQPGWGRMTHVLENGITYQPPRDWPEVDWLVGDMLIAPGVALGLLRRWMESGKARRIVCNIKLPQEAPYRAVQSVEQYLQKQQQYDWVMKQLYHDRREVTVMAHRR